MDFFGEHMGAGGSNDEGSGLGLRSDLGDPYLL